MKCTTGILNSLCDGLTVFGIIGVKELTKVKLAKWVYEIL
jgi:hypothetical protein